MNPLCPNYKISPCGELDLLIPEFKWDPQRIDDINGAQSKRKICLFERNKTNYLGDIEYAWPAKEKPVFVWNLNLETKDINEKKRPSSRSVNPLEPVYII